MLYALLGFMAKDAPPKNAPNSVSATPSGGGQLLLSQNMDQKPMSLQGAWTSWLKWATLAGRAIVAITTCSPERHKYPDHTYIWRGLGA